jgi:SAM-dependent methyltransferase
MKRVRSSIASPVDADALAGRTIADFGEQWTRYAGNPGYYGSPALLADITGPLLSPSEISGRRVAEIGSGTGRIVRMLAAAGAARIVALEPSDSMLVLKRNTADLGDRVEYVQGRGEDLPGHGVFDLVFSIGVLHHVPDPRPIVVRAFEALKPGGRMLAWLYGREGNGLYLTLAQPLRAATKRLPHPVLATLCRLLDPPLWGYMKLCSYVRLPMHQYMNQHLARLSSNTRRLTIYDQLNPAWTKYYTRAEAFDLLAVAGFIDIRAHRRHGYSWTVIGTRQ